MGHDFNDPRIDWIIRSSKNAQCAPRWWMASHAHTDFVLIHDDDLLASHHEVLGLTLDAAARTAPFAVGGAGVILKPHCGYWQSEHVGLRANHIREDKRVDIIKGLYFCCPTARLAEIGHLDLDAEDDIEVSAKLGNGLGQPHLVLADLQSQFELLAEGDQARKYRVTHRSARDASRWQCFKEQ